MGGKVSAYVNLARHAVRCAGQRRRQSVQHDARAPGHKALPEQADQNQRLLATGSPVFHVLHRVLGS